MFKTTSTNASGFYAFTGLEVALAGGTNITRYIVTVDTADPDLGDCNVPVPPTEYNPPLDSNNPNNDFRFERPPVCNLALNKTCQIPLAPTTPFVCSDAKPIDSLTMIWNGTQAVRIRAWKGVVGSTLLADIDNIQPGQEVRVTGYAADPGGYHQLGLQHQPQPGQPGPGVHCQRRQL